KADPRVREAYLGDSHAFARPA
ncbi:hypothetical protein, partial [Corallococcus exiguus]